MYVNNTVTIAQLGQARAALANIDTGVLQGLRGESVGLQAAQDASTELQGVMKQYTAGGLSGTEQSVYNQYAANFSRYQASLATLVKDLHAGNTQGANTIYNQTAGPLNNSLDQELKQLVTVNNNEAADNVKSLQASSSSSRTLTIAVLAIAIALGAGIAFLVTRLVKRAASDIIQRVDVLSEQGVGDIVTGLENLARGDLTERFDASTDARTEFAKDELGRIDRQVEEMSNALATGKNAYNTAADKLAEILGHVSTTAGTVNIASQQMAATSDETGKASGEVAQAIGAIAQGTERQAQMVEQTRGAVDEVARAVAQSARAHPRPPRWLRMLARLPARASSLPSRPTRRCARCATRPPRSSARSPSWRPSPSRSARSCRRSPGSPSRPTCWP
jgi:methyl-accepting chemotaxis protein